MTNILKALFSLLLISSALVSCKKDEQQSIYRGGQSIKLTATPAMGTFVFVRADNSNPFSSFSWTNPNYIFTTGVSSQNVTYTLEAKRLGSSNWVGTKAVSSNLSKTFSIKEINDDVLTSANGLNLDPGVAQDVQMRLRSSLAGAPQTFVYSNVFTYNITPYSNDPDLWITGSACVSNWTEFPPPPQKFTYNRTTTTFSITIAFVPGKEYKFLTTNGRWQPQWGLPNAAVSIPALGVATTIAGNPATQTGDPAGIPTPIVSGNYKITVDLINKTFKIEAA